MKDMRMVLMLNPPKSDSRLTLKRIGAFPERGKRLKSLELKLPFRDELIESSLTNQQAAGQQPEKKTLMISSRRQVVKE